MNIRSMRNKIDDIELLREKLENGSSSPIHIIVLSEIWIHENENKFHHLKNYEAYFSNRESKRAGGCAIYVHKKMLSSPIVNIEWQNNNFLMIKLTQLNLHILGVYRDCTSNIQQFAEKIENEFFRFKRIIILGDMNINLQNNDNDTHTYKETITSSGLQILNSIENDMYTRKSNTVNTFIDHAITNITNNKFKVVLHDDPISDHRLLTLNVDIADKYVTERPLQSKRVINYENIDRNGEIISQLCQSDNFDAFHTCMKNIIIDNTKIIKNKNNGKQGRKPWANRDFIQLIAERDRLYRLRCLEPHNNDINTAFKALRRRVRNQKNFLKKII